MLGARPSHDGGQQRDRPAGAERGELGRDGREPGREQPDRDNRGRHGEPRVGQPPRHALDARRSFTVQKRQLLPASPQLDGERVREIVAIEPRGAQSPHARQRHHDRQHQQPADQARRRDSGAQVRGGEELQGEERDRKPHDRAVRERDR